MSKTEVILTHNIVGLGAESDHVKVAPGYARNYLFPQGLAIPLTGANKRRIEVLRQRRGKMFGSVTSGTIADELKHLFDITLDKKKIHLDHPIKTLGDHELELRLHPEVTTTLKVHVESTTPLPQPVEAPDAKGREGRDGRPGRDARGGREGYERRGKRPEGKAEAKPEHKAEARPERKPAAKVEKAGKTDKTEKKPKSEKAK
jgi:large subunit ribosomal protein L9